jgi:carboxymethylenebutenolidase
MPAITPRYRRACCRLATLVLLTALAAVDGCDRIANQKQTGGTPVTKAQPEGFLATPATGKGPGVLVLHAWWGLNETMKAFCTRLAGEGFVAFAPDLFHGKVATSTHDAESLVSAHDGQRAKRDIADAVDFLSGLAPPDGRVLAVIGFSFGAYYALDLSIADPERIRTVVIFYGTGPEDFTRSKANYLGHFGEKDPFEPEASVVGLEQALRQAGRSVTFHRYPGTGHWFFEPDRLDAYHRDAAELAWHRTVAFLKEELPPSSRGTGAP